MSLDPNPLCLQLAIAGFDIAQPFCSEWYNAHIHEQSLSLKPLPSFGRVGGTFCLLIGNTRELWPVFLRWLRDQPDPAMSDPLDAYIQTVVLALLTTHCPFALDIFWPGEMGDRLVSMPRAAATSGLCSHDPDNQLCIHPTFGSWLSFRALVVFDSAPLTRAPPSLCPDYLSEAEKAAIQEVCASRPHPITVQSSYSLASVLHTTLSGMSGTPAPSAYRRWLRSAHLAFSSRRSS